MAQGLVPPRSGLAAGAARLAPYRDRLTARGPTCCGCPLRAFVASTRSMAIVYVLFALAAAPWSRPVLALRRRPGSRCRRPCRRA
jgi:hypothetical protein